MGACMKKRQKSRAVAAAVTAHNARHASGFSRKDRRLVFRAFDRRSSSPVNWNKLITDNPVAVRALLKAHGVHPAVIDQAFGVTHED